MARRLAQVGASMLALCLTAATALAQGSLEYAVKANYLVRFAAFVEWPAAVMGPSTSPIVLCVAGPDPFGQELDKAVAGRTVNGRRLVVRRMPRAQSGSGCHILYLARSLPRDQLAQLSGEPVLTVTDGGGMGRGMVHFAISGDRVRFHIDDAAAGRSGLTISSRLLTLALTVKARS